MSQSVVEKTKYINLLVTAIVVKDDKFLMIREAKEHVYGQWNFPGGKIDWHEELNQAVKREALEETGYNIELDDLLGVYYVAIDNYKGMTIRFIYWAHISDEIQHPLAKDVLLAEWKTKTEIKELLETKKLRSQMSERIAKAVLEDIHFPASIVYELF